MKSTFILILVVFLSIGAFAQTDNSKFNLTDNSGYRSYDVTKQSPDIQSEKEKDFSFAINPYLWTAATGGYAGLPNTMEYAFNLKFTDAVEDLQFAAMVAGRFQYKPVSLIYDVSYLKLKPELSIPVTNTGGYITGSSEFEQFVGDFAFGYRIPIRDKSVQLDCYGGVRVWSLSNAINLTTPGGVTESHSASKTFVDPILGAFANFDFEKKWFTYLRGDIGGFGAASDFTSVFMWGIGYKFDEHWNTSFGIKSLYTNYDQEKIVWDVWQTGLLLSVGYRL
jgi:hypothetical protein